MATTTIPHPRERPCLSQALTDSEITDCLKNAFDSLSPEDQANVERALVDILAIPRMGMKSALRLLFVVMFGEELDQLDAAIKEGQLERA